MQFTPFVSESAIWSSSYLATSAGVTSDTSLMFSSLICSTTSLMQRSNLTSYTPLPLRSVSCLYDSATSDMDHQCHYHYQLGWVVLAQICVEFVKERMDLIGGLMNHFTISKNSNKSGIKLSNWRKGLFHSMVSPREHTFYGREMLSADQLGLFSFCILLKTMLMAMTVH